jgi:hypothetical protein
MEPAFPTLKRGANKRCASGVAYLDVVLAVVNKVVLFQIDQPSGVEPPVFLALFGTTEVVP